MRETAINNPAEVANKRRPSLMLGSIKYGSNTNKYIPKQRMENEFAENMYIRSWWIDRSISKETEYFSNLPVVRNLFERGPLSLKKPVTFLVGENGVGKSTLLGAIAVCSGFNPEGGTNNFRFATKETHSGLYHYLKLARRGRQLDVFFLRAESTYNVATELDYLYSDRAVFPKFYGGRSLREQSHGESFMSVVLERFAGDGLCILDEPEAALSPTRQMTLLSAIRHLVNDRSQFIISTHSPILMAYPDAEIYELTEEDIMLTPYEDMEHYQITKRFLSDHKRMLIHLFE